MGSINAGYEIGMQYPLMTGIVVGLIIVVVLVVAVNR